MDIGVLAQPAMAMTHASIKNRLTHGTGTSKLEPGIAALPLTYNCIGLMNTAIVLSVPMYVGLDTQSSGRAETASTLDSTYSATRDLRRDQDGNIDIPLSSLLQGHAHAHGLEALVRLHPAPAVSWRDLWPRPSAFEIDIACEQFQLILRHLQLILIDCLLVRWHMGAKVAARHHRPFSPFLH